MDGQGETPDISVIVPTLNEAQNIDPLLTRLFQAFREEGRRIEVLFADGGSTDGTREKALAWASREPVRLVDARSGRGLAGDVVVAARRAQAGVLVVLDGDLSHSPETAPALARPVLEGCQDMVIGSRYVAGGETPDWPWRRRLMSRLATGVVWPLTDVHDPTSGFFAIRRERLLDIGDDAEGFKIGLEVLLRGQKDLRVSEIPIRFGDRSCGRSKMSLRQAGCYLRRAIALTGGAATFETARRFSLAGLLGLAVDAGTFQLLQSLDLSLAASHILSYLLATALVYAISSRWAFRSRAASRIDWETHVRFFTVCLMALFLRGGVLAMLMQRAGWTPLQALIPAAVTAAIINYMGCAFFVFRRDNGGTGVLSWRIAAIGWIGYTLLLRLVYLGLPDLLPEEAYYWNYAQHLDWSYLDHPPMVAWLIALGTAVFGDTEFGVRVVTFLCWFVTAGFCFGLARNLFDKGTALVAAMLTAVLPCFFLFGFFTTPDAPVTACWAGALFFLERALLAGRGRAWWGVGVCVGLGLLSKYTAALLGPAALAFLLLDRPSRRRLLRPEPYMAILVAALLFMPVILWNSRYDWVSFAFQSTRRLSEQSQFTLHVIPIAAMVLITPLGVLDAFRAIFSSRLARDACHVEPGTPRDPRHTTRRRLFMAVFTVVPLSVFILFSLRHEVKTHWIGPLWLAVLPGIAERIACTSYKGETAHPRFWPLTLAVTALLLGGLLHYTVIGFPGVGIDDNQNLPVAWEEIGRDIEQLEERIEANLGVEPLVVGMDRYFMASELAFYRRDGREGVEQTCSRHLFGGSGLMWEVWCPLEKQAGRVLLLVSLNRRSLERPNIPRWARLDPIEERSFSKHGARIRYFVRIAHDYRPPPPEACPDLSFPRKS